MSDWDIIVPVQSVNLVTNPSFETATTGWTFDGANTGAAASAPMKFGHQSCLCTYQDDTDLAREIQTLAVARKL